MNDGKKFEKDFADFMIQELGWKSAKTRQFRTGKISDFTYEIDIHATKGGEQFDKLRKLGMLTIILTFLGFLLYETQEVQSLILSTGIPPSDLATYAILFSLFGFVIGMYGKNNLEKHAWVECKDTKKRVNRKQINNLKNSVEDVRNVSKSDSKWYPDEMIFASKNGFNPDAITHANEYGITLYEGSGKSFKKIH